MNNIVQWFRDFRDYAAEVWQAEWVPLSQAEAIGWMLFFVCFLWYAIGKEGGDFLFLDSGNAVVHEGGHALFGHFGSFLGVAGGTILQLLVPLLLALAFLVRRQAVGYALFLLIVFENLLYVAKYMSDARVRALMYIAIGVGSFSGDEMQDPSMHDWYNLFSRFGVLQYDTRIAAVVFKIAWAGIIATVLWFACRCYASWRAGWQ
ncbi:MAG: hypothetical protein ACXVZT_04195 [Terriglobales bacterium]